jgi:hypothetical protein
MEIYNLKYHKGQTAQNKEIKKLVKTFWVLILLKFQMELIYKHHS